MNIVQRFRKAGELPSQDVPFFRTAWREFIELQVTDQKTWAQRHYEWMALENRTELLAFKGSECVGGVLLHDDYDNHVGNCLTIGMQYVMPEHRNRNVGVALFRAALKIAKQRGYNVVMYSHRVGDWTYLIKYRKV